MRLAVRGAWIACFTVIALGATRFERPGASVPETPHGQGIERCASCHAAIADRYVETAHFKTSVAVSAAGVLGPLPAHVRTSVPTTRFRVETRADGVHQVATWLAADRVASRSERLDLVIGSGRRGHSFLYWKDGLLYQLPLSYLTVGRRWVNSPGYVDGEVHFDRMIPPRCLECHATSFRLEGALPRLKYAPQYELGLGCQVCHRRSTDNRDPRGGAGHPEAAIVNPAKLPRQRQIDLCAVCHAGADREPRRAPFTFMPGDSLADHLGPPQEPEAPEPDVHGSQVALLARSRCFQQSRDMTCATCHDVHDTERDLTRLSARCVACHAPAAAGRAGAATLPDTHAAFATGVDTCVGCHMPLRPSRLIRIAEGDRTLAPSYRTHRIAIYPRGGNPAADASGDRR